MRTGFCPDGRRGSAGGLRALGLAIACLAAIALAPPAAAQVLVDDFSTDQTVLVVPPGTPDSSSVAGAGILGGTRDLAVDLLGGAGPVSAGVAAGQLDFTVAAASTGEALVAWDGDSDPVNLDPAGLGNADLTAGGASAFRLNAGASTSPVDAVIEVFSDGANSSVAALVLPVGPPADLFLPFSEFIPVQGAGADFSDVGAVTLTLRGSDAGAAVTIFETVQPALAATKVDALTGDADSDAAADPGDTLTYTITITNPGGEGLSVDLSDMVDANTTLVGGSVSSTPVVKNEQYTAVGNVTLMVDGTPLPPLLANDADPDGGPLEVAAVASPSAKGGTVTLTDAATGAFEYTPAPGFRGVDTFTYTVQDDDLNAVVGTATVLVEGIVWFVDNTNTGCGSPPCGVGTQSDPFQTFKQAETASAANDIIRIRQGDGTAAGHDLGFILKPGQRLVGGAADLVIGGEVIEAGAGHSVHSHAAGNVLDLAGDHVIEGMRLTPTTGHGVAGTGSSAVTLDNVIIYTAGAAGGVSLTNHGGSFTFSNSMITSTVGTTGVAVVINGGSGLFNFAGSPVSHDGGGLIHVQNTNAATVDFTGSNPTLANGTNHGILLANNTAGSFTFDAIADVITGAGDGIRIAGSGMVTLDTVGNVSATGGAALDVSTSILAKFGPPGPITFASLASTGGAVGVQLNGVVPPVTVNGTTTVNGATGVNLEASGPVTLAGQAQVTSTAGTAIRAHDTGLLSIPAASSTVASTGGPALDILNSPLGVTLASLAANPGAGGRGVSLVGATGTLTSAGGAITGGTGDVAFNVDGGSAAVTHGGTVTQNNAQRVVNIEDTTGGAVNFTAKVTGGQNSTGVRIHNADGNASFADLDLGTDAARMASTALTLSGGSAGTFTFADTQIFTAGATGLDANNGGTVEVTGAGNRVTTSNGVAVNMHSGTTIGTNGVTFQRVDASNAANGIVLNGTGAGGVFEVTGEGASDPAVAVGTRGRTLNLDGGGTMSGLNTGGVITGTTSHGVFLTNVGSVRLRNLAIGDTTATVGQPADVAASVGGHGVRLATGTDLTLDNVLISRTEIHGLDGSSVTGLNIINSEILNAGNAVDEHGVNLLELLGTNAITSSIVDGHHSRGIRVQNDTKTSAVTADTLTVSNTRVSNSDPIAGEIGIHFASAGSSNFSLSVLDGVIETVEGNGIGVFSGGNNAGDPSEAHLQVQRTTITGVASGDLKVPTAIQVNPSLEGNSTFDIRNNNPTDGGGFSGMPTAAIIIKNDSNGLLRGSIVNNVVSSGGEGAFVVADGASGATTVTGTVQITLSGNTLTSSGAHGMLFSTQDGAVNLEAEIGTNTTTAGGPAFSFQNGIFLDVQTGTACFNLATAAGAGNNIATGAGSGEGIFLQKTGGTVNLEGFGGGNDAAAATFINNNNTSNPAAGVFSGNTIGTAACANTP